MPRREENDRGDEASVGRRPNIRDVAQLAGVAVSSASRVLSDHPDVSPAMRRRVLDAVVQLDYEPDFLAQSLRRGATFSAGFVVRDISSPLLAAVALGAETTLRASGYAMFVLNSDADSALDAEHLRLLERRRVDGALISVADESDRETLAALRSLSIPTVLIDREMPGVKDASAVLADHESAINAVLEHLASLGHRRIGLVAGPQTVRPGREAVRATNACATKLGLDVLVDSGPFTEEHGHQAAEMMLAGSPAPTALISGSNQIFPGVLRAIRERKLRIPREISLVTFDDLLLLDLLDPPVDLVRRGPQAFGEVAASLLLRRLKGEPPETVVVPTAFEPRGSSAPPPRR